MVKASYLEIVAIVGEEHAKDWSLIKPTIYYKDLMPYGLIGGTVHEDGVYFVASTVSSPEMSFTRGMLKDIIGMINNTNVCLVTDDKEYVDKMMETLKRFNMRYVIKNGVLYSFNDKDK